MTDFLAKSATMTFPTAVTLFAGSREIATNRAPVADGLSFDQYEVIALAADGSIIKFDPAGAAPANVAQGVILNSVDTTETTGQESGYYTAGDFNHEALVWPAALTTLAARKAVFNRTSIAISALV